MSSTESCHSLVWPAHSDMAPPLISFTCVALCDSTAALLVFLQFNVIKLDSSAVTVSIHLLLVSFCLKMFVKVLKN